MVVTCALAWVSVTGPEQEDTVVVEPPARATVCGDTKPCPKIRLIVPAFISVAISPGAIVVLPPSQEQEKTWKG